MERLVMVVHLLLVVVYIISECDCDMISLDDAMCPTNNKTVIYATVERVIDSDATGNKLYQMIMEVLFKAGSNALEFSNNNRFTMRFPSQEMSCGRNFPVDLYTSYVIAGDVDSNDIFSSNMCLYVRPLNEVMQLLAENKLILGITKPSCGRSRK